jgi:hypothetical protein
MMANEKHLVDVNGNYTISAADNTDHTLCFSDGIISVLDKCGHVVCEFHAEDMPAVNAEDVVVGQWDDNGNCLACGKNVYDDIDADIWSRYAPPRCPNCGAKMKTDNQVVENQTGINEETAFASARKGSKVFLEAHGYIKQDDYLNSALKACKEFNKELDNKTFDK